MIRRLFWITVGAGIGIYAFRRLTRTAQSYTPQGLAARAQTGLEDGASKARSFAADVRALARNRELELRAAIVAGPRPERPELPTGQGLRRGDGRELRARRGDDVNARPTDRHGD